MGLFDFLKSDKKAEKPAKQAAPAAEKSVNEKPANAQELIQKAKELLEKADTLEGDARIDALNEAGASYVDAGETDLAIEVFEKSIEEYKMPGKAQQQLVKLYNAKRREAAMSKDGAAAKAYLDKVNAIMDLSKNAIRGRN